MRLTPLEYTLLILVECLGAATLTVATIVLVSLFIAFIIDKINDHLDIF